MRFAMFLLLWLVPHIATATELLIQDPNTGGPSVLLCGQEYFFRIGKPLTWESDDQFASELGAVKAFFPTEEKLQAGSVFIYVQVRAKSAAVPSLDAHIADTLELFRAASPDAAATLVGTLTLPNNVTAPLYLYQYSNDIRPSYEAVAYVEEPHSINYIVLNSTTIEGRELARPALQEMLRAYEYFGDSCQGQEGTR